MKFKIFTNDRGKDDRGVSMYSCFMEVEAPSRAEATRKAKGRLKRTGFSEPPYAPAAIIKWPPQTPEEKAWVRKHV